MSTLPYTLCPHTTLSRVPPRRFCARCQSPESRFEPGPGTGVVRSLAVSHRSMDPGWQAQVPFATLVVELDEGPRVLAATRADPEEVPNGTDRTSTRLNSSH